MSGDIYGFDYDRAMVLKAVADTPRLVNQLHLKRRGTSGGSGGSRLVVAPEAGIPAASWNGANTQLTPGQAECFVMRWDTDKWHKESDEITVYNMVTRVVGADGRTLQAKIIDGMWVADVEDCEAE
jgi:hypothetical protein